MTLLIILGAKYLIAVPILVALYIVYRRERLERLRVGLLHHAATRCLACLRPPPEWERKTKRQGNLAEFLAGSPLRDSWLEPGRRKDPARDLDL